MRDLPRGRGGAAGGSRFPRSITAPPAPNVGTPARLRLGGERHPGARGRPLPGQKGCRWSSWQGWLEEGWHCPGTLHLPPSLTCPGVTTQCSPAMTTPNAMTTSHPAARVAPASSFVLPAAHLHDTHGAYLGDFSPTPHLEFDRGSCSSPVPELRTLCPIFKWREEDENSIACQRLKFAFHE